MELKKAIIIGLLIFFAGCGGMKYEGKYIVAKVPMAPVDEFKLGELVVLAFENTDIYAREDWLYQYYVYRKSEKISEWIVRPENVGQRRYYLKRKTTKGWRTEATFDTQPTLKSVNDRMIAILKSMSN